MGMRAIFQYLPYKVFGIYLIFTFTYQINIDKTSYYNSS